MSNSVDHNRLTEGRPVQLEKNGKIGMNELREMRTEGKPLHIAYTRGYRGVYVLSWMDKSESEKYQQMAHDERFRVVFVRS